MDVSQCRRTQADISIDDWFGRYTIYRGGEEALIEAGVIRREFVAGLGTGTRALVLEPRGGFTLVNDGKKGNYVTDALRERGLYTIQRTRKGNLRVCKYRTKAEERAHEEARQKAYAEDQRGNEIKRASALMESWPKSVNAFRESSLNYADLSLGILERKLVDGYEGGYRLADDAVLRLQGLVDEMMELIRTEHVVMDRALRGKYTPECIRESEKAVEATLAEQYGTNVVPFRQKLRESGGKPL